MRQPHDDPPLDRRELEGNRADGRRRRRGRRRVRLDGERASEGIENSTSARPSRCAAPALSSASAGLCGGCFREKNRSRRAESECRLPAVVDLYRRGGMDEGRERWLQGYGMAVRFATRGPGVPIHRSARSARSIRRAHHARPPSSCGREVFPARALGVPARSRDLVNDLLDGAPYRVAEHHRGVESVVRGGVEGDEIEVAEDRRARAPTPRLRRCPRGPESRRREG